MFVTTMNSILKQSPFYVIMYPPREPLSIIPKDELGGYISHPQSDLKISPSKRDYPKNKVRKTISGEKIIVLYLISYNI